MRTRNPGFETPGYTEDSDLSMWLDSMRKIKFREFDTPEDLTDFEKSPACGIPPNTEMDPNNVMAAIIDTQVFSWQSFKSAQLEKASSNTAILTTMENVIRLGFEIVHPDKRLTIWHFLHLLDHFLRQVRELPWGDVPFLEQRYGIALVTDNGKIVPKNLTENQIYLSGSLVPRPPGQPLVHPVYFSEAPGKYPPLE